MNIAELKKRWVKNPSGGFFIFYKMNVYGFYFLGVCAMSSWVELL